MAKWLKTSGQMWSSWKNCNNTYRNMKRTECQCLFLKDVWNKLPAQGPFKIVPL